MKLFLLVLIGEIWSSFLELNLAYEVLSFGLLRVWVVCFLGVIVANKPTEESEFVRLKELACSVWRFGSWFWMNFILLYFFLDSSDITNAFLSCMAIPFFRSIVSYVFNCLSKPIFGMTFLPFALTYSIASLNVQFYFFMRYEITKVGAFINPHAYPRHASRAMHQNIPSPYLSLYNLIEIIKEIRHVLALTI